MATSSSIRITGDGFAVLAGNVDLQPTASGAWTNTGLELTLPAAGVYHLDASVRAALSGTSTVNTWIVARLWDVTAGALVPSSEVLVHQISLSTAGAAVTNGSNQHGAISVRYAVPAARLVRLQVARVNGAGASASAAILSADNGRTTLRYERIT
ncbi:hypothetical protein [Streptomyces sp. NPDC102437]|uniref:hypothetical protein n=1 Tax=Streptomyces sp. NPDC102437 TaxID=3366175 RepID=UPI0037F43396